ncbi:e1fad658-32c6-41e0-a2f2-f68ef716f755 [Sclerotinia trifoliorum]|uniref:E1fad658-32c6-41e0-a2f2-f68ef716f755 n=1 Tax=Sclerotinia trifoliorum TaxID=28548 RepID=A0A8H2ZWZ8_9HELO|nr:e1fad658-32c6-41e0-a2f2-f68ef716f755 [Sclerotinia trifoliorum]
MVQYFPSIKPEFAEWAIAQPVFFTASAPRWGRHVNVSPKGLLDATFTVLGPNSCAYIDATGSGIETISHIYENGRVTIMFCSFTSTPRIMRFFCTGHVIEWNTPQFSSLLSKMGKARVDGARAIILLDVWKVQTSCGYGVPTHTPLSTQIENPSQGPWTSRQTLGHWASQKVAKSEMQDYQVLNNSYSLDALPGLKSARNQRFGGNVVRVRGDELVFWGRDCEGVDGFGDGIVDGVLVGVWMSGLWGGTGFGFGFGFEMWLVGLEGSEYDGEESCEC